MEPDHKLEKALLKYSELGHINTVRESLEKGANVNYCNLKGATPLHYAANKGHIQIAQSLLEYGARVNTQEDSKRTPLHFAAGDGFTDIVKLLLVNGAYINERNIRDETALHYATRYKHVPVVQILLDDPKINVDVRDSSGYKAADYIHDDSAVDQPDCKKNNAITMLFFKYEEKKKKEREREIFKMEYKKFKDV